MKLIDNLIIRAKHVDVSTMAHDTIKELIIHLPDASTRERLKELNRNTTINGITLMDEFDDGSIDEHENPSTFAAVSCFYENWNKQHTVTLILVDLSEVWRLKEIT